MKLLRLEVEHFRSIGAARLEFGERLTVIHAPNDFGKSTIAEAIRAAFLVATGSAESRTYWTWGSVEPPHVIATFEAKGSTWRVEKTFTSGSRGKAYLERAVSDGSRFQKVAEGREVEGKLREILSWGISPPGGRGAPTKSDSFLLTALLGRQGEVGAVLAASLDKDQDQTGRDAITRALGALGQDPLVTRALDVLSDRLGEAFTATGRQKRTADSPLVKVQMELKGLEDELRGKEEVVRRGQAVEAEVRDLLATRDEALAARDDARRNLTEVRERRVRTDSKQKLAQVIVECREQLEQADRLARALAESEQALTDAQATLDEATTRYRDAHLRAEDAERRAREAGDRYARAEAAQSSAQEVAEHERERRRAELERQRDTHAARLTQVQVALEAVSELRTLEEQLRVAQQSAERASTELTRAELSRERDDVAAKLTRIDLARAGAADAENAHRRETETEAAARAALAQAQADLNLATAARDEARARLAGARRGVDERALRVKERDIEVTRARADRDAAQRAVEVAQGVAARQVRLEAVRAEAQSGASKAEALARQHGDAASALDTCERELRELRAADVQLQRESLTERIGALEHTDAQARERRKAAADKRAEAARIEQDAANRALPTEEQVRAWRVLDVARQQPEPTREPPSRSLPPAPLIGLVVAVVSGILAALVLSLVMALLIGAALGLTAWAIVALASGSRSATPVLNEVERERHHPEERWRLEVLPALAAAGVENLDGVEAARHDIRALRSRAELLRVEAAADEEAAVRASEASSELPALRRQLNELSHQVETDSSTLTGLVEQHRSDPEELRRRIASHESEAGQLRATRDALDRDLAIARGLSETTRQRARDEEASYEAAVSALGFPLDEALNAGAASLAEAKAVLQRAMADRAADPAPTAAGDVDAAQADVDKGEAAVAAARELADIRRAELEAAVTAVARSGATFEASQQAVANDGREDVQRRLYELNVKLAGLGAGDGQQTPYEAARGGAAAAEAAVRRIEGALEPARERVDGLGLALDDLPAERLRAEDGLRETEAALAAIGTGVSGERDVIAEASEELREASLAAAQAAEGLEAAKTAASSARSVMQEAGEAAAHARAALEAARRQASALDRSIHEVRLEQAEMQAALLADGLDASAEDEASAVARLEEAEHGLRYAEANLNEARGKLHSIAGHVEAERLEHLREAVDRTRAHADDQQLEYEATRLLWERMTEAEAGRASHLGRTLAPPVSNTFQELTRGRYAQVDLDPDLQTKGVQAQGDIRDIDVLSMGTRDQLATILRLSIAAHLKTAIVLDDQLVHSDPARLAWFRGRLRQSVRDFEHQAIVFTCRPQDYLSEDEVAGERTSELRVIDLSAVVER